MSSSNVNPNPTNQSVILTQTSSTAVTVVKKPKKADISSLLGNVAQQAPAPISASATNTASGPQVSNLPANAATNQAVTSSLGSAASTNTHADQIMDKFLNDVPQLSGKDKDKYLQSGDKRIEDAIRKQLADPAEPNKTYGNLFKDRDEFENFCAVLFARLEKQRDKRESVTIKMGKTYEGMDQSLVRNQFNKVYDDLANGRIDKEELDEAKKMLNPPQQPTVTLDPKTQTNTTQQTPFANFKHNEKALVQKFIEVTFPNNPKDTDTFLEAGNSTLENAIQGQINQPSKFIEKYGGLIKDEDQLKEFLTDLNRYLELEGREAQEKCNRENKVYNGVPFLDIKKAIGVRVGELADNKLQMNFAGYAVSATGGPAVALSYIFVQAQTLAFLNSLAAAQKNEREREGHHLELNTRNDTNHTSSDTIGSLMAEINRDFKELTEQMKKLTKEEFNRALLQFYEKYKELIFERKIKEESEKTDLT